MKNNNCNTCNKPYSPACDYMQGRCPQHTALLDQVLVDNYKSRFYNVLKSIKNIFTKDDCDCGHKH